MRAAALLAFSIGAQNFQSALDEGIRRYWNGEYEATVGVLQPACEMQTDLGNTVECRKYLAFSQVALGNDLAAEESFADILAADPGYRLDETLVSPKILTRFEASRRRLATTLYEEGKQSYQDDDFEAALTRFDEALRLNPENDLAREYRDLVNERLSIAEARISIEEPAAESPLEGETPAVPEDYDQVFRLTSDIVAPTLISQSPPQYPSVARQMRWTGTVVLSVVVDKEGNVTEPSVIRPLRDSLDNAAIQAVSRWRYRPATKNGYPVAVHWIIQINFEI